MNAKKSGILGQHYAILPADWKKFEHNILKLAKSIFAFSENDEGGQYRGIGDRASGNFIAKWYVDELEVYTDIPKAEFYKMARGQNNDVAKLIFEK